MVDMDMIRTINTSAHDLRGIADGSVQAVITSPPYYGLRSYAGDQDVEWPSVTYRLNEWCEPVTVQGCEPGCKHEWVEYQGKVQSGGIGTGVVGSHQDDRTHFSATSRYCQHCGGWRGPLGLEPSPVAYIGHLILCLREWRRVLRDDGVVFCNLGDSYATQGGSREYGSSDGGNGRGPAVGGNRQPAQGVKPKDLLGIPWMFAFAARADGWWLRSDIIWAKPNPMPESVTDRPTKAHEYIFMLAKSARYFWDAEGVKEENTWPDHNRFGNKDAAARMVEKLTGNMAPGKHPEPTRTGRNIRTVWNIATAPYPGAHYAVFPPKLVEPMIRASTSERGCCPNCGAAWRRVVETPKYPKDLRAKPGDDGVKVGYGHKEVNTTGSGQAMQNWRNENPPTTLGWQPACTCDAGDPVPCTVLDPFAGSGTTGRVAASLGRAAILVDVSAEYLTQHVPERTTVQIGLPQL